MWYRFFRHRLTQLPVSNIPEECPRGILLLKPRNPGADHLGENGQKHARSEICYGNGWEGMDRPVSGRADAIRNTSTHAAVAAAKGHLGTQWPGAQAGTTVGSIT